jgi:hypothetical protein
VFDVVMMASDDCFSVVVAGSSSWGRVECGGDDDCGVGWKV